MSERITRMDSFEEITENILRAKKELDELFTINMKEDALKIIQKMIACNTDINKSALSNHQSSLLKILKSVPSYVEKHHRINANGGKEAVGILEKFDSVEKNAEAIEKYSKYVAELKSVSELDSIFLEKIEMLHEIYKSSSDYMTRTVKRLLNEYNKDVEDEEGKYDLSETTRLLILKHFINQFGYAEELSGKKKFNNASLKRYVEEKCNGDFMLMDDSVFGLLDAPRQYVDAATKLLGTIRYKAPITLMNKELAEEVCSLMEESVLSEKVKNATPVFLSDCFSKPYNEIDIKCFKDYLNPENTDSFVRVNEILKKRCQIGQLQHTDFSYAERFYSIIKGYSETLCLDKDIKKYCYYLFGHKMKSFSEPVKLRKFIDKKVLQDESIAERLPADIIRESGMSWKERFEILMLKLGNKIDCTDDLREKIIAVLGTDELVSLPKEHFIGTFFTPKVLGEGVVSEEKAAALVDLLERALIKKDDLNATDYLDLLVNHYGRFVRVKALTPECIELISKYLTAFVKNAKLSDVMDNAVLSEIADKLPADIIKESGISPKDRFKIMVLKLSKEIDADVDLWKQVNCILGSDDLLAALPKQMLGKLIDKKALKNYELSEKKAIEIIDFLERKLLKKDDLCALDYLNLLVNYYSEVIEVCELNPLYTDLFPEYIKCLQKEATVADIFDVEKIDFSDIGNTDLKEAVELLEMKLLKGKGTAKKEEEYVSGIVKHISKTNNIKYVEKVTYENYSLIIRLVTVLIEFSKIVPAETEILHALGAALPRFNFKVSKNSGNLYDIVKDYDDKIKRLREYDDVGKNTGALSEFLALAEKYIVEEKQNKNYEKALKSLLFGRYNESVKAQKGDLYSANKKIIVSKISPEKDVSGCAFVQMADNLAKAKFSGQGESSRELLYIFATAFGMTYGKDNAFVDKNRDVEKNLFMDYYCDNIVNNTEEALNDKKKYISGKGINYKNFAETAFLWALGSEENKTAKDKLLAAYDVIDYCVENGKPRSEFEQTENGIKDNNALTEMYRSDYYSDKIIFKTRDEVKDYIVKNFPCSNESNCFGVNAENRTARKYISEYGRDVGWLFEDVVSFLSLNKEDFLDIGQDDDEMEYSDMNEYKRLTKNFYGSFYDFNNLCDKKEVQDLLGMITKRLKIIKDGKLTYNQICRTTLLVLCYYHVRLITMLKRNQEPEASSFSDFCQKFCYRGFTFEDQNVITTVYEGADTILSAAGYQPINFKNILDIYLVFLAYRDAIAPYYQEE